MSCHSAEPRPFAPTGCLNPDSVPLRRRARDGRRRELPSMLYCRPRESGSGLDALAFDGAVDRRAAHAPKSSATSRLLYSPRCTSETRCASWRRLSLGCLPRSRPLASATLMPSRVRSRIRSDSNLSVVLHNGVHPFALDLTGRGHRRWKHAQLAQFTVRSRVDRTGRRWERTRLSPLAARLRQDTTGRAAYVGRGAGCRPGPGQGRVVAAGASGVQGPGRLVGLPPDAVARAGFRTGHRHGRQPRPGGGPDGQSLRGRGNGVRPGGDAARDPRGDRSRGRAGGPARCRL